MNNHKNAALALGIAVGSPFEDIVGEFIHTDTGFLGMEPHAEDVADWLGVDDDFAQAVLDAVEDRYHDRKRFEENKRSQ